MRGRDAFEALPETVADRVGREGEGVLALVGPRGNVALPVRWRAEANALYAALPAETLALADVPADADAVLSFDRGSVWRARDKVGAMIQGEASCFVDGEVGSGAGSLRTVLTSLSPTADALVRLVPRRVVWWEG